MAATNVPHLANDVGAEKIFIGVKELQCMGARPPFDLDAGYPWSPLLKPRFAVRLDTDPDRKPLVTRSYREFLGRGRISVGAFPLAPTSAGP